MSLLQMFLPAKTSTANVNDLLQRITKRAERLDPKQQAATFVALGGMEHALLSADNRVIFGRRGTGKTHILSFVAESARRQGDLAVQVDCRSIGSHSYLYIDQEVPISERATRLLRDFVATLHDKLLEQVTEPRTKYDIGRLGAAIDRIGESVKEVKVRDTVETKVANQAQREYTLGIASNAKASSLSPSLELSGNMAEKRFRGGSSEIKESSHFRLSVNIGQIHRALTDFADKCNHRVWILVDEWSALPEALQPYLADLIKRSLFPIAKYSIHIAAIEQRSSFRQGQGAETIGIELGSDASADVNLDDYLVFENNPLRSLSFFRDMLYKHLIAVSEGTKVPFRDAEHFLAATFTQAPAFRQLVRASEGVPRDAINILQLAANRAQNEKISIPHIQAAAKDWYERDKASYVANNAEADAMLRWIVKSVIGEKRSKAFLVKSGVKNEVLERLFDERILHIAKKSYSAKDDPTTRYRIWKIDYGCYVDRLNTSQAPTGFLFENDDVSDDGFVVPEDDFRAIRRAILDLDDFRRDREGQCAESSAP